MINIPSVLKLIVAVFFLSILPVLGYPLTPDQVFDKVKDSIVVVKTLDAQGKVKGQGSGVLLPSGKIATNCHVVEGGASYQVSRGKELVSATLYAEDGDKDICLLDAKGITGKPAQLGKAAGLKVGVPVYAVGAPQGLELSLSDGIVAQLRGEPPPLIQTTAAISPGSSGGGLFDGEGRLVGLTTLYLEGGQSLNFAIPVEWIGEVKPGRKTVAEGRSQTEWLKRAIALAQMKDWQGLLDWCRKWTKSEPEHATAWEFLGATYYDLKRYNDAIEAYRQAIRISPEYAGAWKNLGVAYSIINHYNDAIDAFRQAIRINPEYAGAWSNLGVTYNNIKRYNDAIEAYRQAIRINPELAGAWRDLGVAYGYLKRYNDAIEAYRQAIRINPEYAEAWSNLGLAYFLSGNRTAALEAVQKLRRLDPEKADKLFNLIVPR
jgi:tetratricopeptide (TPR) repeat protein